MYMINKGGSLISNRKGEPGRENQYQLRVALLPRERAGLAAELRKLYLSISSFNAWYMASTPDCILARNMAEINALQLAFRLNRVTDGLIIVEVQKDERSSHLGIPRLLFRLRKAAKRLKRSENRMKAIDEKGLPESFHYRIIDYGDVTDKERSQFLRPFNRCHLPFVYIESVLRGIEFKFSLYSTRMLSGNRSAVSDNEFERIRRWVVNHEEELWAAWSDNEFEALLGSD